MEPCDVDSRPQVLLEQFCHLDLWAKPSGLSMLPESDDLEVFGGDGCGGCFYLWHAQARGEQIPVVYLSSYGETSRLAPDFATALKIVVGFPSYWEEMLVHAHKGENLDDVISWYEKDLKPEYAAARLELASLLELDLTTAKDDLLTAVHAQPPFAPTLNCGRPTQAGSFKNRYA